MTATCPNHGTLQEVLARVGDGTHLRMALACGCHPSSDEIANLPTSDLPPAPVLTPTIEDTPQFDPAVEKARLKAMMEEVLLEMTQTQFATTATPTVAPAPTPTTLLNELTANG